ncbi:aspartate/glutamate racemase family protein [Geosporobacter ferrireducens]|uniref:aspartate/glutamate racemase family protein n=1 Tax=Geosporobacter ferrireducens TaxID=1424294 RepID=UPI00139D2046|nr:amino acid racemase [Geosporobacter ferrireducens]MTI56442.1 amino acid racemase [Geosporobacter ferrireducens]
MTEKILGILGGMGPEATSYFFHQLIKATPVKKDGDHIKTIIFNNPQIPDRTEAILGRGESPVEVMAKSARILEQVEVSTIFMPCFTAHYFFDEVQAQIHTPMTNLLKIIHHYIEEHHKDVKTVGILCTDGTIKSKIFEKELEHYNIIYPQQDIQASCVVEAIYGEKGIKAGYTEGEPAERLTKAAQHLKAQGAQLVIMGCTEIPLAFKDESIDVPVINSMKIAAQYFVKQFKG